MKKSKYKRRIVEKQKDWKRNNNSNRRWRSNHEKLDKRKEDNLKC